MGDFPYVEWLARLYKKVGEFSGSWTDYIKVSLLWYERAIKTDNIFCGFAILKVKSNDTGFGVTKMQLLLIW